MAHLKGDEYWAVAHPDDHIFKWSLGRTKLSAILQYLECTDTDYLDRQSALVEWRKHREAGVKLIVVRLTFVANTIKEARAGMSDYTTVHADGSGTLTFSTSVCRWTHVEFLGGGKEEWETGCKGYVSGIIGENPRHCKHCGGKVEVV